MDLRNKKVYVQGSYEKVLDCLLSLGCHINYFSRDFILDVMKNELPVLLIDENLGIFHFSDYEDFKRSGCREIYERDIFEFAENWENRVEGGIYVIDFNIDGFVSRERYKEGEMVNRIRTFNKRKDSELLAEKMQLFLEMTQFAIVNNGDWEPDFENDAINIFGLHINVSNVVEVCCSYITIDGYINQVVFKSEEIAQEALEEFGERIKELYL